MSERKTSSTLWYMGDILRQIRDPRPNLQRGGGGETGGREDEEKRSIRKKFVGIKNQTKVVVWYSPCLPGTSLRLVRVSFPVLLNGLSSILPLTVPNLLPFLPFNHKSPMFQSQNVPFYLRHLPTIVLAYLDELR